MQRRSTRRCWPGASPRGPSFWERPTVKLAKVCLWLGGGVEPFAFPLVIAKVSRFFLECNWGPFKFGFRLSFFFPLKTGASPEGPPSRKKRESGRSHLPSFSRVIAKVLRHIVFGCNQEQFESRSQVQSFLFSSKHAGPCRLDKDLGSTAFFTKCQAGNRCPRAGVGKWGRGGCSKKACLCKREGGG